MKNASYISVPEVIDRIKAALHVRTDAELGEKLGVARALISCWRSRSAAAVIDVCVAVAAEHGCSLDWLVLGRGDAAGKPKPVPPRKNMTITVNAIDAEAGVLFLRRNLAAFEKALATTLKKDD